MATCKDCLHCEACKKFNKIRTNVINDSKRGTENLCELYADKSRFVELPCKAGWIPTDVKLPEEDECEYLVIVNGEYTNDEYANGPYATQRFERAVEIALYIEEEGWILEAYPDWDDLVITHWMPLPEPPKEEREQ